MFFLYFGRKSEFETRCWVDKTFFLFNRLLSCCCYMTYGVLKIFKLYSSCPPKALESWELLDFFWNICCFFLGGEGSAWGWPQFSELWRGDGASREVKSSASDRNWHDSYRWESGSHGRANVHVDVTDWNISDAEFYKWIAWMGKELAKFRKNKHKCAICSLNVAKNPLTSDAIMRLCDFLEDTEAALWLGNDPMFVPFVPTRIW